MGLAAALLLAGVCVAENWPQFRGPRGDGTSLEKPTGPLRLLWKTKIPGPGHSSPVVWGDRIFLTAFEPEAGLLRTIAGYRGRLWVLCFRRTDGRELWRREVKADAIEKTTAENQPASPTPATDGDRVYAFFGSFGLVAFSMDGAPVWDLKIGPYANHMGSGSSPVFAGGHLILNAESDGPSFLYSIDGRTGKVIWRVPRTTRQAAYSTAVAWDRSIVVAGHQQLMAYAAADGRDLWTTPGLSDYVVPTPVTGAGLLFATSNGPGGNLVLALRPGGEVAWRALRGGAYVASPVFDGARLFTLDRNCVLSCLSASDGRLKWQRRLTAGSQCSASPVLASSTLFAVTEAGAIHWLDAADEFRPRGSYRLDQPVMASPAISGGLFLLRSDSHLFAFGQ